MNPVSLILIITFVLLSDWASGLTKQERICDDDGISESNCLKRFSCEYEDVQMCWELFCSISTLNVSIQLQLNYQKLLLISKCLVGCCFFF